MMKILVIDDNQDNLTAIKGLLKSFRPEYVVHTAESGAAGLRLAKAEKPDTILLDIKMPEMDGYETCQRFKEDDELRQIPIIFITAAKTSPEDRIKGLQLGGDAYLYKPIDHGELLAQIEVMLRIKKAEDQLRTENKTLEDKVNERTRELLELNAKYLDSYENAPDMFVSVDARTAKILRCNRTLTRALGYAKKEIIDQPVFFIYHPDCYEEAKRCFRKFTETGDIHDTELQLKRKDGSKIDVSLNVSAVRDDKNNILYSRSILRDITERKQMEEALKLTQFAVENISDAVYWMGPDAQLVYVNAAACKALGYSREELLSLSVHDIDPEFPREVWSKHWRELQQKKTFIFESVHQKKDGSIFPVEIAVNYIQFGRQEYNCAFVRDITNRKQTEEKLKVLQEFAGNIIKSSLNMIITVDVRRHITEFNPAAERVFGYSRKEILGKHINILYASEEEGQIIHDKTLENGQHVQEVLNKRKNGEVFTALVASSTLTDSQGKLVGVMGISSDISEQKETLSKLKESEEKFRSITNSAVDAIISINSEGFIQTWNQAAKNMFGYTSSEMINKNLLNIIPGKYKDKHKHAITHLSTTGQPRLVGQTIEVSALRKNHSEFPCELSLSSWEINGKRHYTAIIRDLTERKRVEEEREQALFEVQKANKVKDLFLANISHEIRTPLVSILGFSEIIEQRFKNNLGPDDQEYFHIIRKSSQRLINTVHEILDIAQFEAGTIYYKPQPIQLFKTIEWIYTEFKSQAEEKNLGFTFENTIRDKVVFIDEPTTVKAISNIVKNAIIYTDTGTVNLFLEEQSDKIVLTIRDTGVGMSPEYMDRLFGLFSQESTGYNKKYQGLGLGLAIAKRYLDINHVAIDVTSAKGEGTTFRLFFPQADPSIRESHESARTVPSTRRKPAKEKPLVLLVEDDEYNRKTINIFLSPTYQTCMATSVAEAKEQLTAHDVDLILLDISLEGNEDGLELVKYLRASHQWKEIPIVAVTAHALPKDRDNCLNAGCNDYVSKPFNTQKLLKVIRKYI
ncbi:MAG: PAS domain S-box protein [FCB group bacterium]|nr:PAS domain S-box protein [FCB group bacterium]